MISYMKVNIMPNYTILFFFFSHSGSFLPSLSLGCPTCVAARIGATYLILTETGATGGEMALNMEGKCSAPVTWDTFIQPKR